MDTHGGSSKINNPIDKYSQTRGPKDREKSLKASKAHGESGTFRGDLQRVHRSLATWLEFVDGQTTQPWILLLTRLTEGPTSHYEVKYEYI